MGREGGGKRGKEGGEGGKGWKMGGRTVAAKGWLGRRGGSDRGREWGREGGKKVRREALPGRECNFFPQAPRN